VRGAGACRWPWQEQGVGKRGLEGDDAVCLKTGLIFVRPFIRNQLHLHFFGKLFSQQNRRIRLIEFLLSSQKPEKRFRKLLSSPGWVPETQQAAWNSNFGGKFFTFYDKMRRELENGCG
jgi:hypothetical protein